MYKILEKTQFSEKVFKFRIEAPAIAKHAHAGQFLMVRANETGELPNYRKSKTLRELVIQINTIESEADELYINAMRNLHVNGKDPLEVIAWRDVYAFLEYCADCCENVADVVDSIVMKNS